MSALERTLLIKLTAVLVILFAVAAVIAVVKGHKQNDQNNPSASTQHAGPASPQSAESIYNSLSPGMTEEELFDKNGKPDEDSAGRRPGVYGYGSDNSNQEKLKQEAVPNGRYDAGKTRYLYYTRGASVVTIILISTLDGNHPQTRQTSELWVVLEYSVS